MVLAWSGWLVLFLAGELKQLRVSLISFFVPICFCMHRPSCWLLCWWIILLFSSISTRQDTQKMLGSQQQTGLKRTKHHEKIEQQKLYRTHTSLHEEGNPKARIEQLFNSESVTQKWRLRISQDPELVLRSSKHH